MTISIELQILNKIEKARRGALFFGDSFASLGNAFAAGKALERLAQSGKRLSADAGKYDLWGIPDLCGVDRQTGRTSSQNQPG